MKTIISLTCVFYLTLQFSFSQSQFSPTSLLPDVSEYSNFYDYKADMERHYEDKAKGKGTGYKQWKRQEAYLINRMGPNGEFLNIGQLYMKAQKEVVQNEKLNRAHTGSWTSLGPSSVTFDGPQCKAGGMGRLTSIAFHPSNNNIIWVGSAAGGLWKTFTGGNSWTCISNGLPTLGVGSIAVDHSDPDHIYILTGDSDGTDSPSIGVVETFNGGDEWHPTGFNFNMPLCDGNDRGYDLRIDPSDPNRLFVATTCGLYRTINSGATWQLISTGFFLDIEFHPTNSQVIYAATRNQMIRSFNGGNTWSIITDPFLPNNGNGGSASLTIRVELAVSGDASNNVWALFGGSTGTGLVGVYRSEDQGSNWEVLTTSPNLLANTEDGSGTTSQAGYDLAMAVDHNDDRDIIVGGVNMWRTTSGGSGASSWSISSHWSTCGFTEFAHADIHEIEYRNGIAYACTDGGLYKSSDDGLNWEDLSTGLEIAQFYDVAGTPQNTNLFVAGAQDNGVNVMSSGNYLHQLSGDGTTSLISYLDQGNRWCSTQSGDLWHSVAGLWLSDSPPDNGSFTSTPYIMDYQDPEILFGGLSRFWRRNLVFGFSVWTDLGSTESSFYVALAQAKSNLQVVYMLNPSKIRRASNALTATGPATAPDVTNNLSTLTTANFNDVAVDATNSNHVYVVCGEFRSGEKVFRSTNGGGSWVNISGSLPNVPVNCIVFHENGNTNNPVYIGTDIGVFYRDDDLGDWLPYRNGMPAVPVFSLHINATSNRIVAGTFGRGIWRSTTKSACSTNINLVNGIGFNEGFLKYSVSNKLSSSRTYMHGIGTDINYRAGSEIDLLPGFQVETEGVFFAEIGGCED